MSRYGLIYWGLLPYLLISFITLHFINEDAYIYFRVAENIANGHGYVFNIGGERIETGSSLPWQLLFALLSFTGVHFIIWTKVIGLALGCANLYLIWRLSENYILELKWRYLAVLATATSMPFYMWMQLGLDAPLNTFVLLLLACCLTDIRLRMYWPWVAIAVFITRPEGFFYLLAVVPWLIFTTKQNGFSLKPLLIAIAGCSLLVLARFFYFHDFLPHAFYHKISLSLGEGMYALYRYLCYSGLLLLLFIYFNTFSCQKNRLQDAELQKQLVLSSFLLITTLWSLFGYDWNSYSRHVGTALPFLYLICFSALSRLVHGLLRKALFVVAVILVLLSLVFSHSVEPNEKKQLNPFFPSLITLFVSPDVRYLQFASVFLNPDFEEGKFKGGSDGIALHFMANLGRFLKANYPVDSVVVWDQLGRTPWFAGPEFVFIDNTGLCHREIGYYDYHQRLKNHPSMIHSSYEFIVNKATSTFWPEEERLKSREGIIEDIKNQNPAIIIARASYLEKRPNSLLQALLKQSSNYEKTWLIHNQYIIYENRDLLRKSEPIVPRMVLVEDLTAQ